MEEQFSPPPNFPLAAAMFEGSLSLLAVALGWLLARPPLEACEANPNALIGGALALLPLLVLLALCVWVPVRPFSNIVRIADELLKPLFLECTLVDMAVISLLAGVGEEMLFRGLLQPTLADWIIGPLHEWDSTGQVAAWLAAVVVAVLFGLLHAVNLSYAVLAGLIGLYLGGLLILTGNLAPAIIAHASYDFLALIYLIKIRKAAPHPGPS